MNLNAALIFASAFVHAVSAPLPYVVYRRTGRRAERLFGSLHLVTAFYCFLGGYVRMANTAAAGELPFRFQLATGCGLVFLLLVFADETLGDRARPLSRRLGVPIFLAIVLILSGALTDPADVLLSTMHWSGGPMARAPLSFGLLAFTLGAMCVLLVATFRLLRKASDRAEGRTFAIALLTIGFGWLFDLSMRQLGTDLAFISDHCVSVAVLALGNVLLHRFVRQSREVRRRTEELMEENRRLSQLESKLLKQEQLATVGELSAVIAREVHAPLTAIRHAVEELASGGVQSDEREMLLDTLDDENDRLNRLVRDLLSYARPVAAEFESVSLRDILQEALGELEEDARYHVTLQLSEVPDALEADPRLLRMAFEQIVSNAVEAMPEGGELTVRAELGRVGSSAALVVRFSDTGEGMDTLVRSRAIDPFFTTRSSGTGLGLAIVERLVALHGGRISFGESEHGTTVSIFLPARV